MIYGDFLILSSWLVDKDKVKKKKRSEKRDKEKDGEKEKAKEGNNNKPSPSSPSHHQHHHHQDGKEVDVKPTADKSDTVSVESLSANNTATGIVTPGNGLKIHIKLERNDKSAKPSEPQPKRPSTVKRPPVRPRSSGTYILLFKKLIWIIYRR